MRTLCLFGSAVLGLVACTQDYGQFGFGGGGTGASTSSSTTTTTSTTTGTNTTTSTSSGGGEGGAGGTTTTTTTSSGGGMGGSGGAPPVVSVDCDGTPCVVEGSQRCCWNNGDGEGTCKADGVCTGQVPIECDEQSDCPGQICCANRQAGNLQSITCVNNCSTGQNRRICEAGNAQSCTSGSCQQVPGAPDGYFSCQ
jgi:hypothetical protein